MDNDNKDTTMLSDNAEATQLFETQPKVESTPVADVKPVEKQTEPQLNKNQSVLLADLKKERARRQLAEEEKFKMRQEIDEIKTNYSKLSRSKDDEDLDSDAEKDLGLDKEQAKKVNQHIKKVVEKAVQNVVKPVMVDPVMQAMDNFKQRANEASKNYDDWPEMIPFMEQAMARQIELEGIAAYGKSPEYIYSKALRAKQESEAQVKREAAVDRSNNNSLAVTETGGSSLGRGKGGKITPEMWQANKSNPKWIREHEDELRALMHANKLT